MLARWLAPVWLALALTGCADLAYVQQAISGHWGVWRAAKPVSDWLADPATDATLRARLLRMQAVRRFASDTLALPDNASYTHYAALGREAVVWNVVAAPADALSLKTWCYPLLGCVGYRGYYDRAAAQALADDLRAQGWEVLVYGVPAYSTLGWLNTVGGDPLLDTWWRMADIDGVRLVFHELAHQRLYVSDDTAFNESFATAVGQMGAVQWLAGHADAATRAAVQADDARRAQFRALVQRTRAALAEIYAKKSPSAQMDQALVALKNEAMAGFRSDFAALRASWHGDARWDAWVARANNAAFAIEASYTGWVPAFEVLYADAGCDWPGFYARSAALAAQDPVARTQALTQLAARRAALAEPSCLNPS